MFVILYICNQVSHIPSQLNERIEKMNKDQITLRQQIENFKNGMYKDGYETWYDWFCKDSSLPAKTEKLYKKILRILPSYKVDIDKTYVFFKNNCPMNGSLYDDFRICDIETEDVLFTVTPSNGHTRDKGQADVWGKENSFESPLIQGTWKEVVNFFKEI